MSRPTAWLNHLAAAAVGGTGLVWAWMRYFVAPADEFALVNHPWEPQVASLHILSAPALIFATGLIWQNHAWAKIRTGLRTRRKTGLLLAISIFPMIASGYLLQTAVHETAREIWLWAHLATSGLWGVSYLTHHALRRNG